MGGVLLVMYGSNMIESLWGKVITGVGGSIIAAAITGWTLFLYVWLKQNEFDRLEIIRRFGFINAFENRAAGIKSEYDARLDRVSKSIDIMGFGLRALKEDYSDDFKTWAKRAKVRILLLDPEFPNSDYSFANQRDIEEKNNPGDINDDVKAFIRECKVLLKEENEFEIRLYKCLPSINIFRIDDDLFWGPYLIKDVSRNFPTFIVYQQGVVYKRLLEHFDKVWSDEKFSREVPREWLESDG
jgi:hypothetical protein